MLNQLAVSKTATPNSPTTPGGQPPLNWHFLDLFSTSQTSSRESDKLHAKYHDVQCENNAPYFAYRIKGKTYGIVQGCCNDWNCIRCGLQRAREEYGRIVRGCKELSETHQLWFITITCRGKEMSLDEAENSYGLWTNNLLTRWRTYATRHGQTWAYASVTERQKRGHPHSHILTTWQPPGLEVSSRVRRKRKNNGEYVFVQAETLLSDYVRRSVIDVGLGQEYDISRVESVDGASRYVAKYLFKPDIFRTIWPKGFKRVRYSQNFPKLPDRQTDAFVLMTADDWHKLAGLALIIHPENEEALAEAMFRLKGNTILFKN